jgi:hypothetical protein
MVNLVDKVKDGLGTIVWNLEETFGIPIEFLAVAGLCLNVGSFTGYVLFGEHVYDSFVGPRFADVQSEFVPIFGNGAVRVDYKTWNFQGNTRVLAAFARDNRKYVMFSKDIGQCYDFENGGESFCFNDLQIVGGRRDKLYTPNDCFYDYNCGIGPEVSREIVLKFKKGN